MGKLIGAALLVGCGIWWGLAAAGELRRRERDLGAWLAALTLLEGELAFALPDLPQLLETLSRRAPMPTRAVFAAALRGMDGLGERSFGEIWASALVESPGGLAPRELETLERLGAFLGRYGGEDQRAAAARVREELEKDRDAVREELGRKGKAYVTAGFALGTFLTILLL